MPVMKNIPLKWFVTWVRAAFQAKKDASAIHDLILWSEKLQDWEEKPKIPSILYRNVPPSVNDELRD
jgi:hypothetical protein